MLCGPNQVDVLPGLISLTVCCSKHLQCIYVDRGFKKGDITVSILSALTHAMPLM